MADDHVMQVRIQHLHELEERDRAAIIKLVSYVEHMPCAKATPSTDGPMAANVVRALRALIRALEINSTRLRMRALEDDDSVSFNIKDTVDLMIPVMPGVEDQYTIDKTRTPGTEGSVGEWGEDDGSDDGTVVGAAAGGEFDIGKEGGGDVETDARETRTAERHGFSDGGVGRAERVDDEHGCGTTDRNDDMEIILVKDIDQGPRTGTIAFGEVIANNTLPHAVDALPAKQGFAERNGSSDHKEEDDIPRRL
ncbi:hypothetical protein EDB19DRAFT_1828133 [Suillus lakei]|nr:hypothetical protein EDB19DRAFT_1828133 [Suillus lakei]